MVFGSKVRVDAVGSGHPGSAAGGEVLSPRGASRVRLAVTCGCFGPSVMPRRASGRSSVRLIDVVICRVSVADRSLGSMCREGRGSLKKPVAW